MDIIKDDIVILQMLSEYEIILKKDVDKENLKKFQQKLGVNINQVLNKAFYKGINICTKCKEEVISYGNTHKCINIKIHEQLKKLSVNEQINYLYSLGLPSTFKGTQTSYIVSIHTLKSLAEKLNMLDLKNEIENIENQYINKLNKLNYDNKSKEKQNHLKELIKRKKNHIKYLKATHHTLLNIKKEELQYKIEIEQQKLNYYKHKYKCIENRKNVKNELDIESFKKSLEIFLYENYCKKRIIH